MAFTLAHVAAVLPLYRYQRWLVFDALVIGSMLPDLPYILNDSGVWAQQSHLFVGLISYCLPWGLLVFALWFWLFKPAVIALLQPWYSMQNSSKQQSFAKRPFQMLLGVIVGLLIGAFSHLIWDGITHPDGFIALQVPWLQHIVGLNSVGLSSTQLTVARFLQYISSFIGLWLITRFAWQHVRRLVASITYSDSTPASMQKWQSLLIIGLLCLNGLVFARQAAIKWHKLIENDFYYFLTKISVVTLQGVVGLFFVYAICYWFCYWFFCRSKYRV